MSTKVWVVVPSLRMGGAEIQALRNCEALLGAGYRVTLVTIFNIERDFFAPNARVLQPLGLTLHALLDRRVPATARGAGHFVTVLAQAVSGLKRLARQEKPAVVYTRLWYASLAVWLMGVGMRARPKLVFNEESRFQPHGGAKEWLRRFLLRRADLWVVPCQGLFAEAVSLGMPAASGRILPNVVPSNIGAGLPSGREGAVAAEQAPSNITSEPTHVATASANRAEGEPLPSPKTPEEVVTASIKRAEGEPTLPPKTHVASAPATPSPKRAEAPLVLGFLGRLEPAKGLDRLLDVARGLLATGRDFELRIAGSGMLEASLRAALASDARLEARVTLLGPIVDLAAFFGGIDLLLLTSHYEGFANVIVEANAHGIPVLAMRVAHGPADLIQEGRNGFLVGNGDTAVMVGFLQNVKRERLARMRESCMQLADREFSVHSQEARWRALLEPVACR